MDKVKLLIRILSKFDRYLKGDAFKYRYTRQKMILLDFIFITIVNRDFYIINKR
jgi:hypothetical protein